MGEAPIVRFRDRIEAGQRLAAALTAHAGGGNAIVLALPRGGVPVAGEVARTLNLPLDVLIVRKLGAPGQEELAMGAIASGGVRVLNDDIIAGLAISSTELEEVTRRERAELLRRERAYRSDRPPPRIKGQTVLLVDDGVATGATMFAAIAALKAMRPARIVVAVPVSPPDTLHRLRQAADEVHCLHAPEPFLGVGAWYDDFTQTTDDEVRRALAQPPGP